jgi:hypothetical protein
MMVASVATYRRIFSAIRFISWDMPTFDSELAAFV